MEVETDLYNLSLFVKLMVLLCQILFNLAIANSSLPSSVGSW